MNIDLSTKNTETKDTLFSALSSHRRRYVLYACSQAEDELTLSDVAEQVAVWEYNKPMREISSTERKRIYTSIQQHHLKKLKDSGLITVDGDKIACTEKARNLDVYLDIVPEDTVPWPVYYLGLSLIGSLVLAFNYIGWLPDIVSMAVVGAGVTGALLISSAVHLVQSQRFTMSTKAEDSTPKLLSP